MKNPFNKFYNVSYFLPAKAAKEDRISLVLSFQPANVYQSDKMVYQTSKSTEQEDKKYGVADYVENLKITYS